MGRNLKYLGLVLLAATAWLLIAIEADWVESALVEKAIPILAGAGVISIVLGFLLALASPVGRKLIRERCARCGAPIERGQSYCLDHMREAVNEYQDHARRTDAYRPGRRA